MDIALLGYLLFSLPGFCLIWTYRHFTNPSKISDFEYAIWSFLWGIMIFILYGGIAQESFENIVFDLSKPFELFSTSLGTGLGLALAVSFPIGYLGAWFYHRGLFKWINQKLLKLIQ